MYYAGIDIGGTAVKMCILDGDSEIIVYSENRRTGVQTSRDMAKICADMLATSGYKVDKMGVICAGRVYRDDGTVTSGNLHWFREPLGQYLAEETGVPIIMDNDVQGALYGEWKAGICRGRKNVVYISLGTGIGGAFLLDGRFYRGVANEGGEIGHIVTHADGLKCACGGHGCFECYGSATALSRMAGGISTVDVFAKAKEGDEKMREILRQYVHELCIGISSIMSVLRPEMVVLGGGLSAAGNALLDPIIAELKENSPSIPMADNTQVYLASLGNKAGMMGAALMARDK